MKKIILISVSLFLFSSFVFAYDLEGEWKTSGFVCRSSNGSFKEINNVGGFIYPNVLIFVSDEDGQYFELTVNHLNCRTIASGTYLINEVYLILNTKKVYTDSDSFINSALDGWPCHLSSTLYYGIKPLFERPESLVYDEFFLKNDGLYLYRFDDSLSQQCPDGTIFQHLVRKNANN